VKKTSLQWFEINCIYIYFSINYFIICFIIVKIKDFETRYFLINHLLTQNTSVSLLFHNWIRQVGNKVSGIGTLYLATGIKRIN
jgi:hypothetical protein